MNAIHEDDYTLFQAIDTGDPAVVTACLNKKPDLVECLAGGGCTCLHYAVEFGHIEVVKVLLTTPAVRLLLNRFDEISATPLIIAVRQGCHEIAKLLVDGGADVNAHDEAQIGNTAIREAAEKGSLQLVELLLSAGADPTIPGWMQLNALHEAQQRYEKDRSPENAAILELIIKAVRERRGRS